MKEGNLNVNQPAWGVGLRETVATNGQTEAESSAELREASPGGAQLHVLNVDAKRLQESMEIEVYNKKNKNAKAATIVYIKEDKDINTVGIKWKEPFEEDVGDTFMLAPAS